MDDAKREFQKKFKEKSGLEWADRMDKPKDKKYTYIEKSYEDDNEEDEEAGDDEDDPKTSVKSELDLPTQRLMELIFKYAPSLKDLKIVVPDNDEQREPFQCSARGDRLQQGQVTTWQA